MKWHPRPGDAAVTRELLRTGSMADACAARGLDVAWYRQCARRLTLLEWLETQWAKENGRK